MNKYKRFASDTIVFAIGNFGSKILAFLFVSLYTSYLTKAEYGNADLLVTTISLILPVLSFGIAEGVLRFLQEKNNNPNDVFNIGARFMLIANAVEIVIVVILSFFWSLIQENLFLFLVLFLSISIEELFSYYLKGVNKTKTFAAKGIVFTSIFIVSNIILLKYVGLGLKGFLISHILAYFTSSFFMFVLGRIYLVKLSIKIKRDLLKNMVIYSLAFVPSTIAWWINSSADKYMLVAILGEDSNGLYSVAQKVPTLITAVTTVVTQAWQLSAMRTYGQEGYDDFFSNVYNFLLLLLVVGFGVVLLTSRHIAFLLFKKEFFPAWKFVPMLTVAAVFSTISAFLASAFTSSKKTKMLFISTCIAAALNVVANYFLLISIGDYGAAIATAFSFLIVVIIRLVTIRKLVKLKTNHIVFIASCVIMFCSSVLVAYLDCYYVISIISFFLMLLVNVPTFVFVLKAIKKKKIESKIMEK